MRPASCCAETDGTHPAGRASSAASRQAGSPLPARADSKAEDRVLLRSLERDGIVDLERQRAEQQRSDREPGTEDRHPLDGIASEAPVDRLSGAPSRAGIYEEHGFGRSGRYTEEAHVLGAEQGEPQLEVKHG